ncbi:MAG: tetratricopeptide repeat protein, partial [Bacteroidota bacterium]
MASFYSQVGQEAKAKTVYQNILELEPNDARAAMALVGGNQKSDSDIAFLQSLKPIFANPSAGLDDKVKQLIPFIQKVAQDKSNATPLAMATIELVEILEETHPNNAKVYSAHGDLLYYTGNAAAALEKYQQSIDTRKSVYTVWEQMMYIHTELNDVEALLKLTEEAMDLFPNKAKSYYFNGLANLQQDNYMEAIDMYQQALIMSARDPRMQLELHQRLAEAWYQSGKYDRAWASFDKALALNPKSVKVLSDYSYSLAQQGIQLEKALSLAETATKLKPENPMAQATFGWVYYKKKQYKEARNLFEKAINNGGDRVPVILENYGDVLFQLNEVEAALAQWQKAQAAGGNSSMLEKKIND